MSTRLNRTLFKLALEYILLTLPILVYVALEALHHEKLSYLFTSPEWSIATIFILLQTYRLYDLNNKSTSGHAIGEVLKILLVIFAIAASMNTYMAMGQIEITWLNLSVKWFLFLIASAIFLFVAGAALYSLETEKS